MKTGLDDAHIGMMFGLSASEASEIIKDMTSHIWANSEWLQACRHLSDPRYADIK